MGIIGIDGHYFTSLYFYVSVGVSLLLAFIAAIEINENDYEDK